MRISPMAVVVFGIATIMSMPEYDTTADASISSSTLSSVLSSLPQRRRRRRAGSSELMTTLAVMPRGGALSSEVSSPDQNEDEEEGSNDETKEESPDDDDDNSGSGPLNAIDEDSVYFDAQPDYDKLTAEDDSVVQDDDDDDSVVQDYDLDENADVSSLRLQGKKLHDEGDWESAAELFGRAANLVNDTTSEEYATLRLHEALCHLKGQNYQGCVSVCNDVIVQNDHAAIRARAFHRRAKAKLGLQDEAGALQDARSAAFLGDRRAVALYGKLLRETPKTTQIASSGASDEDEQSDTSGADTSESDVASLLSSLWGNGAASNPFMGDNNNPFLTHPFFANSMNTDNPFANVPMALPSTSSPLKDHGLAKSVLESLSKRLDDKETQDRICAYLQSISVAQVQELATMAGLPLSEKHAAKMISMCHSVTPKTIRRTLANTKRLVFLATLIRKVVQILSRYRMLLIWLVLWGWIKSALRRDIPIDKKAARKVMQAASKLT